MKLLGWLTGLAKWLLLAMAAMLLLWGLWSAWAYRDIPATVLENRYGDNNLYCADFDGQRLCYRLDGPEPGSAPLVLLIHSHYFDSLMFDSWVEVLAQDFTVLRFDMTSHGLTGPDIYNDYSMTRSLQLIDTLLSHIGAQQLAIVGSSLGGNFAFAWAAENPEHVSHLVLANSGGLKREQNSRRSAAGIAPWFYRVFYFVPEFAYRRFLEWMMVDDTVVTDALVERFHAMFRRDGNRFAEMERMRQFDVDDPESALASVRAPTLILWGELNPQLPAALAEEFAERLSSAERVETIVYPGLGHVLPLESPQRAALDIRRFLLE